MKPSKPTDKVYRVTVHCRARQDVLVLASSPEDARVQVQALEGKGTEFLVEAGPLQYAGLLPNPDEWRAVDEYPSAKQGEPLCADLDELAQYVEANCEPGDSLERKQQAIARRVYKDTECGASFIMDQSSARPEYVLLSGYCEGTEGYCPSHELRFPFPHSQWDRTLQACDAEAQDLWNETHGCPRCFGGEPDAEAGGPVDPDCPECKGNGVVL